MENASKDMLKKQEDNKIKTETLIVEKNVLKFENTTIQLSSISKINVGNIKTKIETPFYAIGGIVGSLVLISLDINTMITVLCIAILGLSIFYIYRLFKNKEEDKIFLNLECHSHMIMF